MSAGSDQLKAGSNKEWNWHPDLPVAVSPLFSWPPKPIATLRWFAANWLPVTEFTIYALMAWATWVWLQPGLEEMRTLEWGWILQVWARNIILMTLFAQGLHVWLYGWRGQGRNFKYDRRGIARNNRKFLFNDQYWDNVTYTLLSGVTIWTMYDIIVWTAYANGWAPMITLSGNPVWFILLFPLMPVIQSFHFLLAAPGTARSLDLQKRSFGAPSQRLDCTLVGPLDAPGGTCRLYGPAVDLPGSARASGSFHLHGLLACIGNRDLPCRVREPGDGEKGTPEDRIVSPPVASPIFRVQLRQSGNALGQLVRILSRRQP